ncbi:hypothetical protein [Nonomuraea sp. NPDC052265]|uniref:hypothetical protein n=1 Tax=Nonomuraea sp. NPDC052265 TaxID=3364374 RepID=UPI0037CA017C
MEGEGQAVAEVAMVGGPADGELAVVELAGDAGVPPSVRDVLVGAGEQGTPVRHRYRLKVGPAGGSWVYQYAGAAV